MQNYHCHAAHSAHYKASLVVYRLFYAYLVQVLSQHLNAAMAFPVRLPRVAIDAFPFHLNLV